MTDNHRRHRIELLRRLEELLRMMTDSSVERLEYDEETQIVTVVYKTGWSRRTSIEADSDPYIILDIMRLV